MKGQDYVWANSYLATDKDLINAYVRSETSFQKLCSTVYSFDIGVVSFPDIDFAEQYAQTCELAGIKYRFLFQCRINPKASEECCDGKIYFCPKESIRPYGILIKKVC